MKKPNNGWVKIPSVTRKGKFFYRHPKENITVLQDWLTGRWLAHDDSTSCVLITATTSKDAMRLALTRRTSRP